MNNLDNSVTGASGGLAALAAQCCCRGPWEKITISTVPSTINMGANVERIEQAWRRHRRMAPGVWDGPLARLESWSEAGGALTLGLSPTSYRIFLGTNAGDVPAACVLPTEQRANPLGVSALLFACDGRAVLGRRSAQTSLYPGLWHPFGGTCEQSDHHPEAAMRTELAEEIGVIDADIVALTAVALCEDPMLKQPELIFAVTVRLTVEQLAARLASAEHSAILAWRTDEPWPDQLSPVAAMTLALAVTQNEAEAPASRQNCLAVAAIASPLRR